MQRPYFSLIAQSGIDASIAHPSFVIPQALRNDASQFGSTAKAASLPSVTAFAMTKVMAPRFTFSCACLFVHLCTVGICRSIPGATCIGKVDNSVEGSPLLPRLPCCTHYFLQGIECFCTKAHAFKFGCRLQLSS